MREVESIAILPSSVKEIHFAKCMCTVLTLYMRNYFLVLRSPEPLPHTVTRLEFPESFTQGIISLHPHFLVPFLKIIN